MARENRLAGEISPYLLMHRHNPVDWYPWGEEALARARQEDKPIFLSVGYSTCYWCHVMERESFADAGTAKLMNDNFVNIKVDREERPELDEIYMAATQLFTDSGGWPNSVFLTPELTPFFAGTYFPPHDKARRPSFKTVLLSMQNAWQERREDVEQQAAEMAEAMRQMLEERGAPAETVAPASVLPKAKESLIRRFDEQYGGFGSAPKFPTPSNLWALLELAREGGDAQAGEMVDLTLDAMAEGGIYDQLAGGFHRYATDRQWKVPHFEKMLYDNGLLLETYALDYARTGNPERERILRETANFLAREMTSDGGAFFSAIDAEIHGREGEHHVWTLEQLTEVLGEEDAGFLAPILGFAGPPFFDRDYFVLHLPESYSSQAERRRLPVSQLVEQVRPLKERLWQARLQRDMPLVDDKILTDWNGLTIAGLAVAGMYLEEPSMLEQAQKAADFILAQARDENGGLLHSVRGESARFPAYLADYAAFVRGLLALHEATQDPRWLEHAERLTEEQIDKLEDTKQGGFFAAVEQPDVLFRAKEVFDSAQPAANALAALNLLELAERGDRDRWLPVAERTLRAFSQVLGTRADGARTLALAAYRYHRLASGPSEEEAVAQTVFGLVERASRAIVQPRLEVGDGDSSGWRKFELFLEIRQGWHLYGPASEDDGENPGLQPTRLSSASEMRKVAMPAAEKVMIGDGEVEIYQGQIVIRGELKGQPVVSLSFQPCDDRRCLQATEIEIKPTGDFD